MDVYVEAIGNQGRPLPEILQFGFQERFSLELRSGTIEAVEFEDAENEQAEADDEERLVELPIIDCNSDEDAERDEAREKVRN